jgi:hypothetical protein
VSGFLHHASLALALLALVGVSLRIASRAAARGLERAIAAAVIAVAIAVVEALALGLAGLGSSTGALVAAASLTWAAGLALLPRPALRPGAELARAWRGLEQPGRAAVAALAGAAMAWAVWQLRHPAIGFDSALYHFAEVAGWVHNGRPGSILTLSYDLPYGNYPLTDEVALAWAAGISRSFVPLVLWNPALLVLLGVASWVTVRNLGVRRLPAGLATAAMVTLPLAVHQLNEPQTDLPALTWLACTAALCTGARRTPALLAPAVLAGGLAVGTKPTPAVLVAVALAVGLWWARSGLAGLWQPLTLAAALALAAGGTWYLRNLVQHGSPLWPFSAAPWGDPRPEFLERVDTRLLERPSATMRGRLDMYAGQLAGAVVLLAGALAAFLSGAFGRNPRALRRELVVAGTVAGLAVFAWSMAPGTGLPTSPGLAAPDSWPSSTLRYLLPAIGAATVALALASRVARRAGAAATAALGVAVAWNVVKDVELGAPYVAPPATLALGAAIGLLALGAATAVAWFAGARGRAPRRSPVEAVAAAAATAIVAGVALGAASDGLVERHARTTGSTALGRGVAAWLMRQRGFEDGRTTVAFASRALQAPLAGDNFTHPLELLPARGEGCAAVRARARHSTIVVTDPAFLRGLLGDAPYDAGRCLAGRRPGYLDPPFSVYPPTRREP